MTDLHKKRIDSIDFLKGLVMVIMALDHTRDYFYQPITLLSLTDPAQATIPVYLTRWISHFCAPTFSMLAGISAYLVGRRKTKAELSGFLIKRGLWLLFMEVTFVTFAWYLDVQYRNIDLAVIWSLGISMIVLAALIHLPHKAILIFALALIAGHNLLDGIHFNGHPVWAMIHEFKRWNVSDHLTINIIYPIVPWIAVMALGYYIGRYYDAAVDVSYRKRLFNSIGIGAVVLFVIVRAINSYGDLTPWQPYATTAGTAMSFFNLTKYPPSLLYLLITLGIGFLILANSENWKGKLINFFSVFGRVPFFYYILHLYLIRLSGMAIAEATGYGWESMVQASLDTDLHGFGFNLGIVYLVWIAIILTLYPFCKMFDRYKMAHKEKWWLSYL